MSDFVYWNIVCVIVWLGWKCVSHVLPREVTFGVLVLRRSARGIVGSVLINSRVRLVRKQGTIWRYQSNDHVLPEEWAEKLDLHLAANPLSGV